jgi:acyl carrier protein
MDSQDIKDKLLFFLQNNVLYNESIDEIDHDISLIDNGYIDSIGIIELVTFIEKTFQIKVHDHEIIPENFDSISKIYSYISGKVTVRA